MFSFHTQPLYLQFDSAMCISVIAGDPEYYGMSGIEVGQDAEENIEFLVGVQAGDELELPIISTPNGKPASVYVRSSEDTVSVLMLDAESVHLRQQEIQQKSNEVQLLARRQQQLMEELKQTYRELEKKREEADRANVAQSEFISSMSHEFRTPLTSVIGYAEVLEKSLQNEKSAQQRLGAISRGARHLLSLIENLLDHGQLRQEELLLQSRPTVIGSVVEDLDIIIRPLAEQKSLSFVIDIDESVKNTFYIDGLRYRQILINLLGNAVKFTEQGEVRLSIAWKDEQLTTRVSDTGSGIPKKEHKRVFAAFERVSEGPESGAGLGLSISARLAELMHGDLILESSAPGEGSVFRLMVNAPLSLDNTEAIRDSNASITDGNGDSRRLLLAEDDDDIAMLVVAVLEDAGYVVDRAVNGQEAIQIAMKSNPNVLLMDMNMPVLDGIDAVRELRGKGFTGPAIALSASASASAREKAMQAGCDDYLIKPIDLPALVAAVNKYTELSQIG